MGIIDVNVCNNGLYSPMTAQCHDSLFGIQLELCYTTRPIKLHPFLAVAMGWITVQKLLESVSRMDRNTHRCTATQMEEVRVKKPLNENESIIVCCEKSCFILIFLIGSLFGKGLSV